MNRLSLTQHIIAACIAMVLVGGVLMMTAPALGQVVIDMPPPRTVAEEGAVQPAAGDEPEGEETIVRPESHARNARADRHHPELNLGSLALARYSGARQYARWNDPIANWGYQPYSRGIGPWGLGHPCAWYGNFHVVAPAVFIGGRGERLFR